MPQSTGPLGAGSPASTDNGPRRIALLLPGEGVQARGMGQHLHENEPSFRTAFEQCAQEFAREGIDLEAVTWRTAGPLRATAAVQPALFSVQYATVRALEAHGLVWSAALGHSYGEVTAMTLAGVLSLRDAAQLIRARAELMQACEAGSMLAVALDADEVAPLLGERTVVSAVNGPARTVVSGPTGEIRALEQTVRQRGVRARELETSHAFHSPMMEAAASALAGVLSPISLRPPDRDVFSTVTGDVLTAGQATDPEHWAEHLRQPVRWWPALQRLLATGSWALVDVGPSRTASSLAQEHPAVAEGHVPLVPAAPLSSDLGTEEPASFREAVLRLRTLDGGDASSGGRAAPALLHVAAWREAPGPARSAACDRAPWLVLGPDDLAARLRGLLERQGQRILDHHGDSWAAQVATALDDRADGERVRVLAAVACEPRRASTTAAEYASLCERESFDRVRSVVAPLRARAPVNAELVVVTGAAHSIAGEPAEASRALALGACRAATAETPGLSARFVECDTATLHAAADALRDELVSGAEPHACLRGHRRFVPRWLPTDPSASATGVDDMPEVCLVTGGFGAVGMLAARELVRAGVRKLALLGRTGLPPRDRWDDSRLSPSIRAAVVGVRLLEDAGAQVLSLAADVADTEALGGACDLVEQEFGPVGGVVHAAAVRTHGTGTAATVAGSPVLRPKVLGAAALDAVLGDGLAFEIHVTSSEALSGGPELAAASAADAVLGARCQRSATVRRVCVSLGAAGSGSGTGHGAGGEDPDIGGLLARIIAERLAGHVAVLPPGELDEPPRDADRRTTAAIMPVPAPAGQPREAACPEDGPDGPDELGRVQTFVADLWQQALGVEELGPDDHLFDLGANSLTALEVVEEIQDATGIDLPLLVLFEHPTVRELAERLHAEQSAALA